MSGKHKTALAKKRRNIAYARAAGWIPPTKKKVINKVITDHTYRFSEKKVCRIAQFFACSSYPLYSGASLPNNNNHVATAQLSPRIPQGVGIDDRIGNRVRLYYSELRWTIGNNQNNVGTNHFRGLVRTILTHTKGDLIVANDLSPDPTNPGNNAVTIHSQIRTIKNYTVLMDKVQHMGTVDTDTVVTYGRKRWNTRRLLTFASAVDIAPLDKYQLFIVCGRNQGTTPPSVPDLLYFTGSMVHRYIDV